MTKSYSGTMTIDGESFPITALLAIRGRRIIGTAVFSDDESKEVPINLIINSGLTSFRSLAETAFISPDEDLIVIEVIQAGNTTLDLDIFELSVTDEDATKNGDAILVSLTLVEIAAEPEEVAATSDVAEEVVSVTKKMLIPVRINEMGNHLDHFGGVLSLPRRFKERNNKYKSRILEASHRNRGSSYKGLVQSISLELGLDISKCIRVKKNLDADEAQNAVFSIEEDRAVIYRQWIPIDSQRPGVQPEVEQEILLGDMTVGKLVDWINTSGLFEAKTLSHDEDLAKNIMLTSSRQLVQETLSPSESMSLKYRPVTGTLLIDRASGLTKETSENDRELIGEFSIDYANKKLNPLFLPEKEVSVSYMSNLDEVVLEWASVRIVNLTSEGAQDIYFDQVEKNFYAKERHRLVNGLPTSEMFEILREVMNGQQFPQFWGE